MPLKGLNIQKFGFVVILLRLFDIRNCIKQERNMIMKYSFEQTRCVLFTTILLALMSLQSFLFGSSVGIENLPANEKHPTQSNDVELIPVTREKFFTKVQRERDVIIHAGTLGEYLFSAVPQATSTPEHIIRQELLNLLNEIQLLFKEPIKIKVGYRSPEQHIYEWAKWLHDNPNIITTLNAANHPSWEAWIKASQEFEGCPPLQSKHQTGDAVIFVRSSEDSLSDAGSELLIEHLREIAGTREYTVEERVLYDIPKHDNYLFKIAGIDNEGVLHFNIEYVPCKTPSMPPIDQIGEVKNKTAVRDPVNPPINQLTPVTREMFFTKIQTEEDITIDAGTLGEYRFSTASQVTDISQVFIRQELVDFLNKIQRLFKDQIKIEVGYRSPEQHIYEWAKWLRDNPNSITELNAENHPSWEEWVKESQKFEGCPPLQSKHQTGDAVTFVRSSENSLSGAGSELLIEHLREIGGTREYTAAERVLYEIQMNDNYIFNVLGMMNRKNLQFNVEYVPSQTPPMPNIGQIGENVSKPKPETDLWSLTNPENSFDVTLRDTSTNYQVDGTIMLQTESSENVYIILLKWDVNDALTVLIPNKFHDDNFLRAETIKTIRNKDADYILKLSGPPGTERYKVIALLRSQDNRNILDIFRRDVGTLKEGFLRWEGEKSESIAYEVSTYLDEIASDNWTEHSLSVKVQKAVQTKTEPDNTPPDVSLESFTAKLNVTSDPSGARITVDGKLIGITPMHAQEINIGNAPTKQVKVTLSHEGYQDNQKSITLENEKTATWNNVVMKRTTKAPAGVQTTKMVLIPAGAFMMGTEELKGGDTIPVHKVFLSDYYIDEHEVTVGQYREFVEKTGHRKPPWETVNGISPTDSHPMVGVSWHDAMAYALWVGKRLPTEAEWEKAARGGHIGKDYPWGTNEINPSFAHYKLKNDDNPIERSQPVKTYSANDFGLHDMTGNVAEWCLDEWDATFYYRSPANNPVAGNRTIQQIIASYKDVEGQRVIRGGSFTHEKEVGEVGSRSKDIAKKRFWNIGFRCVKDVSP